MGAFVQVYRPAGETAGDSPSDRFDHLVVVNLRGPLQPDLTLPGYKLITHDRYARHPMLVPVDAQGEAIMCGPSGNFAGSEGTPGWREAVEKITGGVSNLVAVYDDGSREAPSEGRP